MVEVWRCPSAARVPLIWGQTQSIINTAPREKINELAKIR